MLTTRSRTPAIAAALALGAVVLTTACNAATPPPSGSSSTSMASTTPTSATTPTSTTSTSSQEEATTLAEQMVRTYFRTKDESLFDPTKFSKDHYKMVAISSELTNLRNLHGAAVSQKLKQIGYTQVVTASNPRVDLANKPKSNPPEIPTVQFDVCYDVSKVNIVDASGKSVVPADRPGRGIMLVGVSNYSYPDAAQWRVSFTKVQEGKKC